MLIPVLLTVHSLDGSLWPSHSGGGLDAKMLDHAEADSALSAAVGALPDDDEEADAESMASACSSVLARAAREPAPSTLSSSSERMRTSRSGGVRRRGFGDWDGLAVADDDDEGAAKGGGGVVLTVVLLFLRFFLGGASG